MRKSFAKIYDSKVPRNDEGFINQKRDYIATENVDFEGRPVPASVRKVDDPKNRYKGLKASDFSLENQNAVGVQLRPISLCYNTSNDEDNLIKY